LAGAGPVGGAAVGLPQPYARFDVPDSTLVGTLAAARADYENHLPVSVDVLEGRVAQVAAAARHRASIAQPAVSLARPALGCIRTGQRSENRAAPIRGRPRPAAMTPQTRGSGYPGGLPFARDSPWTREILV